jgi:hypothetical protein
VDREYLLLDDDGDGREEVAGVRNGAVFLVGRKKR